MNCAMIGSTSKSVTFWNLYGKVMDEWNQLHATVCSQMSDLEIFQYAPKKTDSHNCICVPHVQEGLHSELQLLKYCITFNELTGRYWPEMKCANKYQSEMKVFLSLWSEILV